MPSAIEIIARLRDEVSSGVGKLGLNLHELAATGQKDLKALGLACGLREQLSSNR